MKLVARLIYRLNRLRWRVCRPVTLGVRVLLVKEGSVVLVKHTYHDHWYLPGGGVKRGETLEDAARREAAEEVGATLGELRLVGAYSSFREHKSDHVVVFACGEFTLAGGAHWEIEGVESFGVGDLPEDVSPATRRRIEEYVGGAELPVVGRW